MIKLNSLQITDTALSQGENLVISPNGYPLLCWVEDGVLKTLESAGSIWPPETVTVYSPSSYVKMGIYDKNYLLFFLDSSSNLQCVEYNGTNFTFYTVVQVAVSVTLFDVTRSSEEIKVVYTSGGKIYVAERDNDSRVWDAGTEVVSEASPITSVSIDYQDGQLVVAYTTATKVNVYQFASSTPFPVIALTGTPSDIVIRLLEWGSFDLVYTEASGNRAIKHVRLSGGVYTKDQIIGHVYDNYNVDLFVSADKVCVVWVRGGYVRYREWNGTSWVNLVGATYIAACDVDSTPKVIYYESSTGYSRVVYRLGDDVFYAGMVPLSQNVNGNFNCSVWGTTKYLDNGSTTVNSVIVENRLSQRVIFKQQSLSIGGVSCYLQKSQDELNLPFSLVMDVYYSDINGNPYSNPIASSTLLSTDISDEGWNEFSFSLDNMLSAIDGCCFVVRQENGDENNCASWLAYTDDGVDARISKDGVIWTVVGNITRSIKVRGNFDAYERIINVDPSMITHQIVTPPAVESIGNQVEHDDLVAGTFDNTKLINIREPDYYTPTPPVDQDARIYGYAGTTSDWRVTLEDKDLIVSFIVDSSGSAGWNDVFDLRHSIVSSLIEKLKTKTGGRVLFDFVKFGGVLVDALNVSITQKVRGFKVSVDDYTSMYGFDADGNPITSGDPRVHFGTGVIGYGFKNLNETNYIVYGMDLGWKEKTFSSLDNNWHTFWVTDEPQFSVDDNGPNGENSVNITVSDDTKANARFFVAYEDKMIREPIAINVLIGDYDTFIADVSDIEVGRRINVLDPDYVNTNFYVEVSDTVLNSLTCTSPSNYNLTTADAFVETFRSQFMETGWENTDVIEFFIVDALQTGAISFFVQTFSGATIEYEVVPMASWDLTSLYFLDETARFEIDAVNSLGENMPDGTMVEFYVDKTPDRRPADVVDPQESYLLTQNGLTGSTILYLSQLDMADFAINKQVEVTDDTKSYDKEPGNGGVFFTYIVEVNTVGYYLVISDPLPENFLMSDNARVVYPATVKKENDFKLTSRLNIVANLVDVTPIYSGRKLDPSFFTDLDRIQVEPTDGYDDYNSDPEHVRRNSIELLLTDSHSAIRLLPVTEDYFLTPELKTALSKSLFNLSAREQIIQNERLSVLSSSSATSSSTAVTEEAAVEEKVYYVPPKDFVMEHVVFVYDGYTYTDMKSFATELEASSYNGNTYLAKDYTIYPVMTFFKYDGSSLAQMFLPTFDVAFACPVTISTTVDHFIDFDCVDNSGDVPVAYTQYCAGDYAASGNEIAITYSVENKDFPMYSGELEIFVYDIRRDIHSATVLDEDLGDVDGCGDTTSNAGGDMIYSAKSPEEIIDEYDLAVQSMLLADSYFTATDFSTTQTIPINRGVATLTLPVNNRIGLFEVHAIYKTSEITKVVHKQRVYYRSPLRIYYIGPTQIVADNNATYDIGAELKWMGVDPVDDGTIVNFASSGGDLRPSVSETVNSIADGVEFRPFAQAPTEVSTEDPSYEQTMSDRLTGEKKAESRTVKISSRYNGFFASVTATLNVGESEKFGDFYFMCRPFPDTIFADGVDYTTVVGDLQESTNRGFPYVDVVGPDMADNNMGCLIAGSDLKVSKLSRWKWVDSTSLTDEKPPAGTYADPDDLPIYAWTNVTSNKFLGRPVFVPSSDISDGPPPCNSPCVEISANTGSSKLIPHVTGVGIDSATVSFLSSTAFGSETIPRPRMYLKEPLGIDVSLEPVNRTEYQEVEWRETPRGKHPETYSLDDYSHPTNRNGEALYYAVVEVTFKDEFIVGTPSNPFPTVFFKSGKLVIESSSEAYTYTFTEDDDWPLSESNAVVAISRTTFDEDHFHECYVNESGIGKTTAAISFNMGTIVADHVHDIDLGATYIVSYAVADKTIMIGETVTTSSVNHIHVPRSVAIIQSGPSMDISLEFAVQGIVTYDNSAVLVDRTLDNYAISNPETESESSHEVYEEQYFLEITTPDDKVNDILVPSFKTVASRHENGQLISFHAWKKTADGVELPLPDGTRIFTSFKFFEPTNQEQIETDKILVIDQDKVREYAVLEINARISGLPVDVSKTKQVLIRSDMYWFPYVSNEIFDGATNDQYYLDAAIASLGEFGGSQIADALIYATNRIIALGTDYEDWLKTFVLISDGGENMSEFSHDQATESVNSLNGEGDCKIFSIKLMDTEPFDSVIMQKYAANTYGEFVKVGKIVGTVDETADAVTDSILESDKFDLLSGTYTNVIDLGEYKKFKGCRFGVIMKVGTEFKFRVRFSTDGTNYGSYYTLPPKSYDNVIGEQLEWYIVEFGSIPSFGRYMQYEVTFKGSITSFESPMFAGNRYEYYEPGRYTMFFQPVEIDDSISYVGEIMFVHEGTIPETSTIKYGITHDDTTDFDSFYYSADQPLFNGGTSGIVLSRFNEKTTTVDYKTYVAVNGGWNDSYDVKVYRCNSSNVRGEEVTSGTYTVDNKSGSITFLTVQPLLDEFTFVITMKPYFRVAVDMKNYTTDTIVLDNLTFAYNLVNRINLTDSDDHRDVTSIVKTDLSTFDIQSSGTLEDDYIFGSSKVGKDTDIMIDMTGYGTRFYLLMHTGVYPYVVDMETNLTIVKSYPLTGKTDFVPLSISNDGTYWYFPERTATGVNVHKFDLTFKFVSSFSSEFDFLESGATFLNIKRLGSKWYVTESDRIHVLTKSLLHESQALLPFYLDGSFTFTNENMFFMAQFKDVIWKTDWNGNPQSYYNVFDPQATNNIVYSGDVFYFISDPRMLRMKTV